jgi:hypothetical protein
MVNHKLDFFAAMRVGVLKIGGMTSEARIRPLHVRFTTNSGHQSDIAECPQCAKKRHRLAGICARSINLKTAERRELCGADTSYR